MSQSNIKILMKIHKYFRRSVTVRETRKRPLAKQKQNERLAHIYSHFS